MTIMAVMMVVVVVMIKMVVATMTIVTGVWITCLRNVSSSRKETMRRER